MALSDTIKTDVSSIISTRWNTRKGQVVPTSSAVLLKGGAVELDATFLYADLANSSRLSKILDRRIAAKILKSFLATSTKLIRVRTGSVLSFDGDRVLGVFVGGHKNTEAARCALNITWVMNEVIRPKFTAAYDSVRDLNFSLGHGVGIDAGTVLVVRAGARGDNDLISIGRAPGLAAKLSDIRELPCRTYITATVYNNMLESSKLGGDPKRDMWEKREFAFAGQTYAVYRSSWQWKP